MQSNASTIPFQADISESEKQLGQYIPLHYHYIMLQDKLRIGAFKKAIESTVRPGMQVVELGGGTGVLSYFAASCGANVTCVERNPVLAGQAQRFLSDNGVADRVHVRTADATKFAPDEPVDLVICEMLHVAMLRERQLDIIAAFKKNYVQRFGLAAGLPVFMPEASVLMVQAVEQDFDFAGYVAPVPLFQALDCEHESTTRSLCELQPYSVVSYDDEIPLQFDVELDLKSNSRGVVNALRFVTQNALAIDLEQQVATSWPNQALVLPIEPQLVVEGDPIGVQFNYASGDSLEQLSESLVARVGGLQRQASQPLRRVA